MHDGGAAAVLVIGSEDMQPPSQQGSEEPLLVGSQVFALQLERQVVVPVSHRCRLRSGHSGPHLQLDLIGDPRSQEQLPICWDVDRVQLVHSSQRLSLQQLQRVREGVHHPEEELV